MIELPQLEELERAVAPEKSTRALLSLSQQSHKTYPAQLEVIQRLMLDEECLYDRPTEAELEKRYLALAEKISDVLAMTEPICAAAECNLQFAGVLPDYSEEGKKRMLSALEEAEQELVSLTDSVANGQGHFSLKHRIGISNLIFRLKAARYHSCQKKQPVDPGDYFQNANNAVYQLFRPGYVEEAELPYFLSRLVSGLPGFIEQGYTALDTYAKSGGKLHEHAVKRTLDQAKELLGAIATHISPLSPRMPDADKQILLSQNSIQALQELTREVPVGEETYTYATGSERLKDIFCYELGLGHIDPEKISHAALQNVSRLKDYLEISRKQVARSLKMPGCVPMQLFMTKLKGHLHFPTDQKYMFEFVSQALTHLETFFASSSPAILPIKKIEIDITPPPGHYKNTPFSVLMQNTYNPHRHMPRAQFMLGPYQHNVTSSFEFLVNVIAHEGMPGHIHHFEHIKDIPDVSLRTGGISTSIGMVEGWGLLSEELALQSGALQYLADKFKLNHHVLTFLNLSMQLLRAARVVIDTKLHLGQFTPTEAHTYLVKECHQDSTLATREVERCMERPGYSSCYYAAYAKLKAMRDLVCDIMVFKHNMTAHQSQHWFYATFLQECGFMPANLVNRYALMKALQEQN